LLKKLQENSKYLRDKFKENNFNIEKSETCVIPVVFRDTEQCLKLHHWMLVNGYFTSLVMAPACAINAPRFRITANSSQTKEELDDIVKIFIRAVEAVPECKEISELLD